MLDILSFITEKGGDPERIRESQKRRYASVEVVDEVIAFYDEWRRGLSLSRIYRLLASYNLACSFWMKKADASPSCLAQFAVDQKNKDINLNQKEIGLRRKNKENADELMEKKAQFEKEKKDLEQVAADKEAELKRKVINIGNLVHDSVPVDNNEVGIFFVPLYTAGL